MGLDGSIPEPIFRDEAGVGRDKIAFSSVVDDVRIQVGERYGSGVERFAGRVSPSKLVIRRLFPGKF
jgi:hypothetical protein